LFQSQGVAGLPVMSPFQRVFSNPGPSLTKLATGSLFCMGVAALRPIGTEALLAMPL
jgi:hypothetical protein